MADRFREHGYCATEPWIAGLFESLEREHDHDHNGTLHATTCGNKETAKRALRRLRPELYPDGPQGLPRRPSRR